MITKLTNRHWPFRRDNNLIRIIVAVLCLAGVVAEAAPQQSGTLFAWGDGVDPAAPHSPIPITNAVALAPRGCIVVTTGGGVIECGEPIRPELTNIVAVAAGTEHRLALRDDGIVLTWQVNSTTPAVRIPFLSNIVAVAAGDYHSVALDRRGIVHAWGDNSLGQTLVPGDLTNAIAIAAGINHSVAVRADGTVVCWGHNNFGGCEVPSDLAGVKSVAVGLMEDLALTTNGILRSFGSRHSVLTGIVAIAGGWNNSLALREDGTVESWGDGLQVPPELPKAFAIGSSVLTNYGLTLLPVITRQPANTNVLAGTPLALSATVLANRTLAYQWLTNGNPRPGATNATLLLDNPLLTDAGEYRLSVSNSHGTTLSQPAYVTVQPFPPRIVNQPTNTSAVAGSMVQFSAELIGAPPLFYQWEFDNRILPGATNAIFALTDVDENQEGMYRVIVSNIYGTAISAPATLTVNYPPSVLTPATQISAPAGTNLVLAARVDGNQPISYQWQLEGVNILGATNVSVVLPNVQSASAGQYALVASNAFGSVTNTVYSLLVVDSPPVIVEQPASQNFATGDTIIMRALASGTAPLSSQWWRDGVAILGATNTSIILTNLHQDHAGTYFVTISNRYGATTSASANLSVGDRFPGQVDWPALGFTQVVPNTFRAPTCITHAGDGSGRLFVVEQAGHVRIIQSNNVLATPFLDITNRVLSGGERGLLSVAFPPGSGAKGHFYVNYTRKPDGATVISRFLISPNPDVADTNSEQVIKVVDQPFANHNGGQLAFGPDGFLYVGLGDGGYSSTARPDPYTNAQNTASLLGKLLRIDVESGASPYAIPRDNPFISDPAYAPEIWALGLRNPWRFSFDRLTGDLFIADVGHEKYEEVNFQPAGSTGGQNYGWPIREGPAPLRQPSGFDVSKLVGPVSSYSHFGGRSITGGYVYRGPNEPRMNGVYFFGDFMFGQISGLKRIGTNWNHFELVPIHQNFASNFMVSTFGEDEQGRLYLADYNLWANPYNPTNGRIYRIDDTRQAAKPVFSPAGTLINSDTITVTSTTPSTTIHYTMDGRDPTEFDPCVPSGGTIKVQNGIPVKVRAFRADLIPSAVTSAAFTLKVATPRFTPFQGPITNGTLLTIDMVTSNAVVHYTLDGATPTTNSPVYTGPIVLNGNVMVAARGFRTGFNDGDVTQVFFDLVPVTTPEFSPASGPITSGTAITITCSTPGASIYYTVDGTTPTTNSILYSSPVILNRDTVLSAIAFKNEYNPSPVQSAAYPLFTVEAPRFSPASGPITNGTRVTISSATPDAMIYYTLDGSVPTTSSTKYVEPIALKGNVTLSAKAIKSGWNDSTVQITYYTLIIPENTVVTTFAGTGEYGYLDGKTTSARFAIPRGIYRDATGIFYIADTHNHRIRKILTSGDVVTLAGSGNIGIVDGFGINAAFNQPTGICGYTNGFMFVVGPEGSRIRRVAPTGNVTTVGPDLQPRLWQIESDPTGNFWVGGANSFFKVTPSGSITAFNGRGSSFDQVGIAIDTSSNLFATTALLIQKVDAAGNEEVFAGSRNEGFSDGPRLTALFRGLGDAAVDAAGNVYVTDYTRVRKISTNGVVSTLAGTGEPGYRDGKGATAQFNGLCGLALDDRGNVYVADSVNNCIRKIWPDNDSDGIPDELEGPGSPFTLGRDDSQVDSDHDGMSNAAEYSAGTNVEDSQSVFAVDHVNFRADGTRIIEWRSHLGRRYQVQSSSDLFAWSDVGSPVVGSGSTVSLTDDQAPHDSAVRFYRVVITNF